MRHIFRQFNPFTANAKHFLSVGFDQNTISGIKININFLVQTSLFEFLLNTAIKNVTIRNKNKWIIFVLETTKKTFYTAFSTGEN